MFVRLHVIIDGEIVLALEKARAATEPRAGWRATVERTRIEIEALLDDSPSLRRLVDEMVAEETLRACRLANTALREHDEMPRVDLKTLAYASDQVLGDWLPACDPI